MNGSGNTIAKNALALFSTQIITWLLSLVLTMITPRYLGPHGFGILAIVLSIWAFANVIGAWGIDIFLIKSVARNPTQTATLVGTALWVRTVLFAAAAVLVGIYLAFQHYSSEILSLTIVIGISVLLNLYANTFYSALQGLELMSKSALITIYNKVLNTFGGLAVLAIGLGAYGLGWVMVAASLLSVIGNGYFLYRRGHLSVQDRVITGPAMIYASTPYLLTGLVLVAYGRIDVLIMANLIDTTTIGWYSAAMTLYGTLLFVPPILASAIFPAITRSYRQDTERLRALISKGFDLTLLIAVPAGLGLMVVSDSIAVLLFGETFAPSGQILKLMGIVLIFMYQNIVMGQFMVSIDRQNTWTILILIGIGLTISLDIIMIPWFQIHYGNGALGAACSYIITEGLMFLAGIVLLPRGLLTRRNFRNGCRIGIAGSIMLLACWWARELFIAVPIVIGAVVYVAAILWLRVISPEDLALGKSFVLQFGTRIQQRVQTVMRRSVS